KPTAYGCPPSDHPNERAALRPPLDLCRTPLELRRPAHSPRRLVHGRGRDTLARSNPLFVGLHLEAELVVIDAEIAVAVAHDRFRPHCFDFLRHHADIGLIAAEIAEAIEAEAVVELTEQADRMLGADVGRHAATAAA